MKREEAIALYQSLGFVSVPLVSRGKRPLKRNWQEGRQEAWLDAPADANIGILTGSPSGGLVVLDFDTPDLCREMLGMTPRALAAVTPVVASSRGHHVYARHPDVSTRVPSKEFSILGESSLVVAPPSVHRSGWIYKFLEPPRRVAAFSEFADPTLLAGRAGSKEPSSDLEMETPAVDGESVSAEEAWEVVRHQDERVVAAWRLITSAPPAERAFEGSGSDVWSRADFLVSLCLIQHGFDPARVARLLVGLPGSKAAVRGMRYAMRTCMRAAETARTGRLPGRAA